MKFLFDLVFRANWFHAVIPLVLLWLGLIFWGLGTTVFEQWGEVAFALAIGVFLICTTNFADMYSDRMEDKIHRPSNPMVTGGFSTETGRKLFLAQNIIGILLILVLIITTQNYAATLVLTAGWIGGLLYSLQPVRLKARKIIGPFEFGLCCGVIPLVGWLAVHPLNSFVAAFALVLFVGGSGVGISTKLRRTAEDFNSGKIKGCNPLKVKTTDFGLQVRYALIIEAILLILAVCLIFVFGKIGTFDGTLALFLILFTAPLIILGFAVRGRNPLKNIRMAEISFFFMCATLPAISLATFISALFYID